MSHGNDALMRALKKPAARLVLQVREAEAICKELIRQVRDAPPQEGWQGAIPLWLLVGLWERHQDLLTWVNRHQKDQIGDFVPHYQELIGQGQAVLILQVGSSGQLGEARNWIDMVSRGHCRECRMVVVVTDPDDARALRQAGFTLFRENGVRTASSSAVFVLPPPPSLLVGRTNELRELSRKILPGRNGRTHSSPQVALLGWPLVGKSALARALANDEIVMAGFPDGVLWTSLGPAPDLPGCLWPWARELKMGEERDFRGLEDLLQKVYRELRHRKVLLVVDDVYQAQDAQAIQEACGKNALLITTRFPKVAREMEISPENTIKLYPLKEKDALDLLITKLPLIKFFFAKEAQALVQAVEGIPLVLLAACRLLKSQLACPDFDFVFVKSWFQDLCKNPTRLLQERGRGSLTILDLLQQSMTPLAKASFEGFRRLGASAFRTDYPHHVRFRLGSNAYGWTEELLNHGLLEALDSGSLYRMHPLLAALAQVQTAGPGIPDTPMPSRKSLWTLTKSLTKLIGALSPGIPSIPPLTPMATVIKGVKKMEANLGLPESVPVFEFEVVEELPDQVSLQGLTVASWAATLGVAVTPPSLGEMRHRSISQLGFPGPTHRLLEQEKIITVDQLLNLDRKKLYNILRLYPEGLTTVMEWLERQGSWSFSGERQ